MIGDTPTLIYTAEVPQGGTSVTVDFSDGVILWDDNSEILWDDGSEILWSHMEDVTPERSYSFSVPRTIYSGEVEQ